VCWPGVGTGPIRPGVFFLVDLSPAMLAEERAVLPAEPHPKIGALRCRVVPIRLDHGRLRAIDRDKYIEMEAGAWYLAGPGTVGVEYIILDLEARRNARSRSPRRPSGRHWFGLRLPH
jgi:hypothetical protein